MKVLAVDRQPGSELLMPPALKLIADSALVLHGNPLFLPEFATEWTGVFYLAYRISRLGKSIRTKFAPRYYDAVTVAMRAMPMDGEFSDGLLGAFDNCLVAGDWIPLPDPGESLLLSIDTQQPLALTASQIGIDQTVENISSFVTLKTGDMVMPCCMPFLVPLTVGDSFAASINGLEVMKARIK